MQTKSFSEILSINDLDYIVHSVGVDWEQLRGRKLLLTGATGFIGKWLLGSLLEANRRLALSAELLIVSRSPERFLQTFPSLRNEKCITWIQGDIKTFFHESLSDVPFVIHGATDVESQSDSISILNTCYLGTQRLLDQLGLRSDRCRLLLLSSGAIYGAIPSYMERIPEDWPGAPDPLKAGSTYGEGKRISELLCFERSNEDPLFEAIVARGFAFVGPHLPLDRHFAVGNFIRAAISKNDMVINGDGTPIRSYLYAADLAYWLWVLLFRGSSGRAYNIGGDEPTSILDLAYRVNQVLGGNGKVTVQCSPKDHNPIGAYVPSIDRMKTEFGLEPFFSLNEAIRLTGQWALNHYAKL